MVDLHTHILPGVDDGADDVNDSAFLVDMLVSQRVDRIALTPHYLPMHESVEDFVAKRDAELEKIKFLEQQKNIRFFTGAEVLFTPLLSAYDNVEKLCISGTRYMLVEFPYDGAFEKNVINGLEALTDRHGIIPVIAHVERYRAVQKNYKLIYSLKEIGCVIQVNSASVTDTPFKSFVKKLVRKDLVDVVSSDCHGRNKRVPKMSEAFRALSEAVDADYALFLENNADLILKNSTLG